jgi:hypothetical protein
MLLSSRFDSQCERWIGNCFEEEVGGNRFLKTSARMRNFLSKAVWLPSSYCLLLNRLETHCIFTVHSPLGDLTTTQILR